VPYAALHTPSASAESSVLMTPCINAHSRSGLAWARCSCRNSAGSILGFAVVAVLLFKWGFADLSKNDVVTAASS